MPDPASMIDVALVEDDAKIRNGLAFLINGSPGLRCVCACASAEDALREFAELGIDVALIDIGLPGLSGIELMGRLRQLSPRTQIMMLTVFEDYDRIFQSLKAGACGYLVKQTTPAKILEAIVDVHHGGPPMTSQIARRVIEQFRTPAAVPAEVADLTARERQILDHLVQGLLYKEIAGTLEISEETVRKHVHHVYGKLHVRNRHEAVMKVLNPPAATGPVLQA
jgi:DNA-binding NarL/FixJ family response regulator